MNVAEMIYDLRTLARHENDYPNKDLFYRSAKTLETLMNVCRMGDHIVSEMKKCQMSETCEPCKDESNIESPIKWPVSEVPIAMIEEFLNELTELGYIHPDKRWPY